MLQHGIKTFEELLGLSTTSPAWFWDAVVKDMGLEWYEPYRQVLDLSGGVEWPRWFVGGKYNYVHDAVDKQALLRPNARAIAWEGEDGEAHHFTFAQLLREVNKAANALIALGVVKGDRVGIFMPMLPETAIASFAVSKIGAIYIPIFSGFGASAVASRLTDCGAKLLITADHFYRGGKPVPMLEVASEAAAAATSLEHLLVVGRKYSQQPSERIDSGSHGQTAVSITWWDELVSIQNTECETARTGAEDPYMIIYTSGTTGRPKGVVHVHSGFPLKAAQELAHCFDLHEGETLFWLSDIGWMMGPWAITGALMLGATCFMYEGAINHPQPDRVWSIVERHRITHLGISPTAVRSLMGHGDEWVHRHDLLSSLIVLAGAGEPWNPEPWRWLFEVVGGGRLPIINYSGGTEVSGGILANNTLLPIKPCAFSAPVPGMAAEIVNANGKPVEQGEVGELALRGVWPGITRGFWGDPQRYLETYWSRVPGLWMHGDWVRVDQDGYWYILGRSDDTIKVAGKRVGPAEVESAAVTHPAVAEAVAIGVPDEVKGEALVVLITLRVSHEVSDELTKEIEEAIVSHLGKSLKPQAVKVVGDVPRTRNGKILRRLAKQAYLGEPLGDVSALENPPALEAIARASPTNR
jgi:acetyl-CoA synthetase